MGDHMIVMTWARRTTAVVIAFAVLLPPPANATAVVAGGLSCAGSLTLTFSPPLTGTASSGTVTQSFAGLCGFAGAAAVTDPLALGQLGYVAETATTTAGTYTGTCEVALLTLGGVQYVLSQGSVAVATTTAPPDAGAPGAFFAAVYALTPNATCDESSASGAGLTGFVFEPLP